MSAPVFRSSGIDPRRLSMREGAMLRQTHGERRRIHGPIRPMAPDPEPPSWATIGTIAALAAAIVAVTWVVIPGLAWLTLELWP